MHRGEVLADQLGPDHRRRDSQNAPGVIVNEDAIGILPLRIIVPLTDWKERYRRRTVVGDGFPRCAEWAGEALRGKTPFKSGRVSQQRFVRRIGRWRVSSNAG